MLAAWALRRRILTFSRYVIAPRTPASTSAAPASATASGLIGANPAVTSSASAHVAASGVNAIVWGASTWSCPGRAIGIHAASASKAIDSGHNTSNGVPGTYVEVAVW